MDRKQVVRKYIDGFRTGDSKKVLECLSEQIVWRLHGCETFNGKAAFAAHIENEEFCEIQSLEIRDLLQDGDRLVAIGCGAVPGESGGQKPFTFCEVFLFEGDLVSEIDTFHLWS